MRAAYALKILTLGLGAILASCVSTPGKKEPSIVDDGSGQSEKIDFVTENYPKKLFLGAWGEGYSVADAVLAAKISLSNQIESSIDAKTSEISQITRYGNNEVSYRNMESSSSMATDFKHAALFREADGSSHKTGDLFHVYVVLEKKAYRRDADKEYSKVAQDLKVLCNRIETTQSASRVALCQDLGGLNSEYDKLLNLSFQWNAVLSQDPPGISGYTACVEQAKSIVAKKAPEKRITINADAIAISKRAKVVAVVQSQSAKSGFAALQGSACQNGYLLTLRDAPVTCKEVVLGHSCDYSPLAVLTECGTGSVISQANVGPFNGLHKTSIEIAQERMFNGISGQSLGQVGSILKQASQGCGFSSVAH